MTNGNTDGRGTENSSAQLIARIYEVVLTPDCYDAFMEEWQRHIDERIARLQEMRDADTISDPVLETHFDRAFSILERLGRGAASENDVGASARRGSILVCRDGSLRKGPGVEMVFNDFGHFSDFETVFAHDSWARLSVVFSDLRRAPQAGRMLVLTLDRADPNQAATSFWIATTVRDELSGEIALRLEPLAPDWGDRIDGLLLDSFRLTPSEIRVVQGLAGGLSLGDLSKSTGRSLNTFRSQLKSIFRKTGTNTQADLVRLVSTLSGATGNLVAAAGGAAVELQTGTLVRISLPDGRHMPVHLLGPDDGVPVVFLHGMLDGIAITGKIYHLLEEFGIRLIAPERPNFGQADPDLRKKTAPEDFARDVGVMIRELRLEQCLMMGHMAGAVYAFSAAAAGMPSVRGVISVSGGVPITSVGQFSLMTRRQRTVAYTARFAPRLLPTVLRAGISQIDSADPEAFMKALYPKGCADRDVVDDPQIAAAILDGYRFAVAQGHRAFEIDSYHVTRDWSLLVRKSVCPVLILHGADDPVVNITTVRDFSRTLGNRATLQVFDDCGQLLFYQEPEQVLASARAFWDRTD